MTNRRQWDVPAALIAGTVGLVVIAASLPFAVGAYCRENGCGGQEPTVAKTFLIGWVPLQHGEPVAASVNDGAPTATATVTLTDMLPSSFRVQMGPEDCADEHDPRLQQQPAQLSWSVLRNGTVVESGTVTCAQGIDKEVTLKGHPDIARREDTTAERALAGIWAEADNETATYTLQVSFQRARVADLPGLPIDPTFAATVRLTMHTWAASATEEPEVPR